MPRGPAQEARQPHLHAIIEIARALHRQWLERAFATYLEQRDRDERARLLAQLYTLTGVHARHLLRHACELSQEETGQALYGMLSKLL